MSGSTATTVRVRAGSGAYPADSSWHFVASFIDATPDNVTGRLCESCFERYYPEAGEPEPRA